MPSNMWRRLLLSAVLLIAAHSAAMSQVAVRIPDANAGVRSLLVIDTNQRAATTGAAELRQTIRSKEVWVGSDDGLYRIDDALKVRKVEQSPPHLRSLASDGKYVWVSAAEGVFRIDVENGTREQIKMPPVLIAAVNRSEGRTLLLTDAGIFLIEDVWSLPSFDEGRADMKALAVLGGRTFLTDGAELYEFAFADNSITPLGAPPARIRDLVALGGRLWLNTDKGLMFYQEGGAFKTVFETTDEIKSLRVSDGDLWFIAGEAIYRVIPYEGTEPTGSAKDAKREDKVHRVADLRPAGVSAAEITTVQYSGGATVGSRSPASDKPTKDGSPPNAASVYTLSTGDFWLGTSKGLYLYKNNTPPRRIPDIDLNVKAMEFTGASLWVATDRGAYMVDRDLNISFNIRSEESWWKFVAEATWLLPNIRVSGTVHPEPGYTKTSFNNFFSISPKTLSTDNMKVLMEMDQSDFDLALRRSADEYALPRNVGKEIKFGTTRVYYSVRDRWGNTLNDSINVVVIPGPFLFTLLVALLWLLSLAVIIYLAPRNMACHQLLMNRNVRKWGYFILAPIAITIVTPVRRHVLSRYFNALGADKDFKNAVKSYVLPSDEFKPERFRAMLEEHGKVYLLGQSGIGKTAYFKFLVGSYTGAGSRRRYRRLPPVFLPLVRYKGSSPALMLHSQLFRYGDFTDEEIVNGFLDRGGFIFFLDGLNEIDSATRDALSQFVEKYGTSNYFFFSSQEDFPEFPGERVFLKSLSKEKVEELLRMRLAERQAEAAIESLTDAAHEIYKIPQDLEMAIELLKRSGPPKGLPQTRESLYAESLDPVFSAWEARGRSTYKVDLFRRAYEMLNLTESSFSTQAGSIVSEMVNDLEKAGFIDKTPDKSVFRHEQIQAFLASKYFAPRWRSLIKEAKVDYGWKSTLEFTFQELEAENDFKDLFFALIDKDYVVATDIFRRLKNVYPAKFEGWQNRFHEKLGEAVTRQPGRQ